MITYQPRLKSWFEQAKYVQKQEESNMQVRGNQVEAKSKLDQVWIPTYVEITAGNKNNN